MSGGGGGGSGADANRRNHHLHLAPLRVPMNSADSRAMELQPILTTPLGLSDAGTPGWANGNGGHSRYHYDVAGDGGGAAAAAASAPLAPRLPPRPPLQLHLSSASTSGNATPVVIIQAPRNLPNPAPSAVWRVAARNLLLILAWYFFSTCLSLWNRTLLGHGHGVAGRGAFPAPMLMTAMQFCVQIVMARFALWMGVEGKSNGNGSGNGSGNGRARRSGARRSGFGGGATKEDDERGFGWQPDAVARGAGGGAGGGGAGAGGGRRRATAVLPSQHRRWSRLSGDAEQPELLPPSFAAPCLLPTTTAATVASSSAAAASPPRSASSSPTMTTTTANNRSPSSSLAATAGAAAAGAAGTTAATAIEGGRSNSNDDDDNDYSPPPSSPRSSSSASASTSPSARLSWKAYFTQVVPNGVCTGLDIGLSNFSLSLISLSFYTMCKSTTPLFLLAFAFAWGLEKPSWSLAGVVAVISSGLMLLVYGEAHFDGVGFALVMTASALSGLRWTITQVLLQGGGARGGGGGGAKRSGAGGKNGSGSSAGANGKLGPSPSSSSPPRSPRGPSSSSGLEAGGGNGHGGSGGAHGNGPAGQGPVAVVAALMPVMALTVALVSLLAERLWVTLPRSPYFDSVESVALTLALVAGGAAIAFAMVWVEFTVIKLTSALTFMVAGTFKEIVTVLAAVVFLGESFSRVNAAGLAVLVAGVALFNYSKYKKVAAEQREQEQQRRRKEEEEEEKEMAAAAAAAPSSAVLATALSPVEAVAGVSSAALAPSSSTSSSSAGNSGEYDVRGLAVAARKRRGGGGGGGPGADGSSVDVDVDVDGGVSGLGGASTALVVERTATPPGSATAAAAGAAAGGAGGGGSPLRPRGAAAGGER